ncbi:MAG: signal peptidase I [Spirochaetaceae bacterium]|jgi:signal peptidase I|nr:signal peptidase I [Spirochaetaceae bacterium]
MARGLRKSWTDKKTDTMRFRIFFFYFLGVFLFYLLFTSLFLCNRVIENDSMRPGLRRGDRILFFSSAFSRLIPLSRPQYRRGELVLVDRLPRARRYFPLELFDAALRFFTAERVGVSRRAGYCSVKRVIGFPGDEVSMVNFVVRVKAASTGHILTEFELWENNKPVYNIEIPSYPALWDVSLPFSGDMEPVRLGEDEYFVLADNRFSTGDSRTWGPVPRDQIAGRALFRYWPPARMGRP